MKGLVLHNGCIQWIARSLVMREVHGSGQSWLRIHYTQMTPSVGHGASTLALKPMGRINQSLKQRVPVALQNGDLTPQKLKEIIKKVNFKLYPLIYMF